MTLPYDVRRNPTWIGVERAKANIRDLAANRKTIGLICGGPGIGKNTLTRQIAKQHLIKYVPEDRPDNAAALVSATWRNITFPLHVLNECDHLLRDPLAMNIIKLMHETPRRCAHYTNEARRNEEYLESGSRQYRESIAPTSFALDDPAKWTRNARQLFTLNLNYTDPEVTRLLPQEHWTALLRRGIDPVFIPTPDRAFFEYVVWLGGEGRMLNNLQFDYPTSRDAIAFYVQNVNRLPELSPGRLVRIAEIIRDYPKDAEMLDRMLSVTDQRDLGLQSSLVQVLLWPRRPPKRAPRPARPQYAPPRPEAPQQATAARELTPEPIIDEPVVADPEPKPIDEPAAEVVVETILPEEAIPVEPVARVEYLPVLWKPPNPAPDPDPPPAARQTRVSPELTLGQAIRAVYALDVRACDRVADILARCPLGDCDNDELCEVAHALDGCSGWHAEHVQSICHTFAQHADGTLLFCTDDEVLVWEGSEKGLQIYRWDSVRNLMAPHIAEATRRWEAQQREQDTKILLTKKLPAKRKLKAVKERIDRIIELKAATFTEKAQRAIDHIRQMTDDDPRFSECTKLEQYIDVAARCLSSGSGSN